MRIDYGRCEHHLNKIIFGSWEAATAYIKLNFPTQKKEAYPCPVKEPPHFHIRDKLLRDRTKRRRARQRRRQREAYDAAFRLSYTEDLRGSSQNE